MSYHNHQGQTITLSEGTYDHIHPQLYAPNTTHTHHSHPVYAVSGSEQPINHSRDLTPFGFLVEENTPLFRGDRPVKYHAANKDYTYYPCVEASGKTFNWVAKTKAGTEVNGVTTNEFPDIFQYDTDATEMTANDTLKAGVGYASDSAATIVELYKMEVLTASDYMRDGCAAFRCIAGFDDGGGTTADKFYAVSGVLLSATALVVLQSREITSALLPMTDDTKLLPEPSVFRVVHGLYDNVTTSGSKGFGVSLLRQRDYVPNFYKAPSLGLVYDATVTGGSSIYSVQVTGNAAAAQCEVEVFSYSSNKLLTSNYVNRSIQITEGVKSVYIRIKNVTVDCAFSGVKTMIIS